MKRVLKTGQADFIQLKTMAFLSVIFCQKSLQMLRALQLIVSEKLYYASVT